jgi:hypothetical protein
MPQPPDDPGAHQNKNLFDLARHPSNDDGPAMPQAARRGGGRETICRPDLSASGAHARSGWHRPLLTRLFAPRGQFLDGDATLQINAAVPAFSTTHGEFLGQRAEFVNVNWRTAFAVGKLTAMIEFLLLLGEKYCHCAQSPELDYK